MESRRDRPRRPQLGIGRVGGGVLGPEIRVLWQHPSGDHAHLSPGREGTGQPDDDMVDDSEEEEEDLDEDLDLV